MAKYYFLGTLLPPLSFDKPFELSFAELEMFFQDQLTEKDQEKVLVLRSFFDLFNLRALWLEQEIDPRGTLTARGLEEAIVSQNGLSEYIYDFLERYQKKEERLRHFPLLLAQFFQKAESLEDSFLRCYLNFERELRLVMTAFRAQKLGRNLSIEFQYEDPEQEVVAQLLAQKEAKNFEPPEKYQGIKELFEVHQSDCLALERALDKYRFEEIEKMAEQAEPFSIERLLAFFLQFLLMEKQSRFDQTKGLQMIEKMIKA